MIKYIPSVNKKKSSDVAGSDVRIQNDGYANESNMYIVTIRNKIFQYS